MYFLLCNSKVYILISQTKKIQTILMNFTGISAKRRKGRTKIEKNKVKKEHFSCTLFEWFFKKLYFSHRGNISKIMGKIQLLQKKVGFSTRKMFLFLLLKNWKNGILHNFAVKFLNEDKGYRWWSLQEWKDLSKVISKHPQLLSVGFIKPDWQLLKLEVFWEKFMNFLAEFEK